MFSCHLSVLVMNFYSEGAYIRSPNSYTLKFLLRADIGCNFYFFVVLLVVLSLFWGQNLYGLALAVGVYMLLLLLI